MGTWVAEAATKPKKSVKLILVTTLVSMLITGFNATVGPSLHVISISREHTEFFHAPLEGSSKEYIARIDEWSKFACAVNDSVELVIGIKSTDCLNQAKLPYLVAKKGGKIRDAFSLGGTIKAVVVDIPLKTFSSFVTDIQGYRFYSYVEPNLKFQVDFVPNDPDWSKQWGPAKIEGDLAWDTQTGSSSILVAVIDTGVDYNHPDLAANYVALGYDWVNNDTDPMDDHGHGTHCAGIIAAILNNAIGIAGLAQVRVMTEKGLNSLGTGYSAILAKAIIHAVDQGARIVSMSWGGVAYSKTLHSALRYAHSRGVLLIASAGNSASDIKHYPSSYEEVISVTATDQSDNPASFTNFGPWVELAAPGVDIYSTFWDDTYSYMSGTSMATPHVAGVAALVWSRFSDMTRDQLRVHLRYSADDLGAPSFDFYYGYGRINARRAVEESPPDHELLILSLEAPIFVRTEESIIVNCTILNFGMSGESNVTVRFMQNGTILNSTTIGFLKSGASITMSYPWSSIVEARYNLTVYVAPVSDEVSFDNNVLSAFFTVASQITVPDVFPSIQKAIDVACPGETILVKSGIYRENVGVYKPLTIIGQGDVTVDAHGFGSAIRINSANVSISGFKLKNGTVGMWIGHGGPFIGYGNIHETLYEYGTRDEQFPTIKNVVVYRNNLTANEVGICIDAASNITLKRNMITDNEWGLTVWGLELSCFIHNIDTSNLIDGKPVYYLVNQQNKEIPVDAGYIGIVNSTGITIRDLCMNRTWDGILLAYTTNSIIYNVTVSNSFNGILLYGSSHNTIRANLLTGNSEGIQFRNLSTHNRVIGNTIIGCGESIFMLDSSNNIFYHNNLINSKYPHTYILDSTNTWDNGTEGNYWDDYAGVDEKSGPSQDEPGSDGIGDTPYTIDEDNVDRYPLMNPWGSDIKPSWRTSFTGSGGYPIVDFAVYNDKLYAASDNTLYMYNGSDWNIINAPTCVLSLEPYEDKLIIGGKDGIYSYDGTTFTLIFTVSTYIKPLGVYSNTLYAGTILDKPPTLYYCNGSAENPDNWHTDTAFSTILNFSDPFGNIDSLAVYNNIMYVTCGGTVYSYNGTDWNITKTNDNVCAYLDMKVYNGKLYLATRDQAWRKPIYLGYSGFSGRIIEFDGNNWTTVFDHDYCIYSLEVYAGKLYAGTANEIDTYNGTHWNISFHSEQGAYYAISFGTFNNTIYAGMGNGYILADPTTKKLSQNHSGSGVSINHTYTIVHDNNTTSSPICKLDRHRFFKLHNSISERRRL